MIVISDTSPITSPAAVGQLDLLRQLYTKILIPEAVYSTSCCYEVQILGMLLAQTKGNSIN